MIKIYFESHIPKKAYEWIESVEDDLNVPKKAKLPFLTYKDTLCKVIHPLETYPLLYRELAYMYPSRNNIVTFAQKYGLLKRENGQMIDKQKSEFIPACSYFSWMHGILDIYLSTFLLELIKEENDLYARKILHVYENDDCALISVKIPLEDIGLEWYKDMVKAFYPGSKSKIQDEFKNKYPDLEGAVLLNTFQARDKFIIEALKHIFRFQWDLEIYKKINEIDNPIETLRYLLIKKIGDIYEKGIDIRHLVDLDKKIDIEQIEETFKYDIAIERYLIPKDLYTALYLQIEKDLLGTRKLRQCRYCGDWFEVTDKRQEYCPRYIKSKNPNTGEIKKIPTGKHCKVYAYRKGI